MSQDDNSQITPDDVATLKKNILKAKRAGNAKPPKKDTLLESVADAPSINDTAPKEDVPAEFTAEYKRVAPLPKTDPSKYKRIEFDDAVAFALFFDPLLSSGERTLHSWQAFSLRLVSSTAFSIEYPLEYNLVAANGSGKDAYFLAIAAAYLLTCKIRSRTVITTKDYTQLSMQTYPYIASFCQNINKRLLELGFTDKKEFIKVRQGHITCEDTGSEIILFVTDEAKRAEGYHPFPDYKHSELTMFYNEAKSVLDPIFQAGRRCTGYCRYIMVSSAGTCSGYFYSEVQRSVVYPAPLQLGKPYARYVTSYDCPHVSPIVIQRDKETLEDWLFGSIHESRFSSIEGNFVCPAEQFNPAMSVANGTPHVDKGKFFIGLDTSLGRDETVLGIAEGNKILEFLSWRIVDNTILEPILAEAIIKWLKHYGLTNDNTSFNADAGGPSAPILNHLRRLIPLKITYCYNNRFAYNRRVYGSMGAEDYFHVKNLIVKKLLVPWPDRYPKLAKQIILRRFEIRSQKIYLEEKVTLKGRGEESPDWADTLVLMFRRYKFTELHTVKDAKEPQTHSSIVKENDPNFDWHAFLNKGFAKVHKPNVSKQTAHTLLTQYYGSTKTNKYGFGR